MTTLRVTARLRWKYASGSGISPTLQQWWEDLDIIGQDGKPCGGVWKDVPLMFVDESEEPDAS